MKNELVYVAHMRDACRLCLDYAAQGETIFFTELVYQDAIFRRLEILGEAAKHVGPQLRQRYPQIPWSKASDLRNFLAHEYEGIKLRIIWELLQDEIPSLLLQLEDLLSDEGWKLPPDPV